MKEKRKTGTPPNRENTARVSVFMTRGTVAWGIRTGRDSRAQQRKLGEALLRLGLAHHTRTAPSDWLIGRLASGGPTVRQSPEPAHELRVSLSHSGRYLVAGVFNGETIGIDVERCRTRRFAEIARHLDWPRAVWSTDGRLCANRFYHAWTLWEAAIKACSDESRRAAESVFGNIILALTLGTPCQVVERPWFAGRWRYRDRFWLSIVGTGPHAPDIRLFEVNRLNSDPWTPQIHEIATTNGHLSPEIFQREEAALALDEH